MFFIIDGFILYQLLLCYRVMVLSIMFFIIDGFILYQ